MTLSKNITNKLRKYFIAQPVYKVYLFGSYSRGDAKRNSDIDLLVVLDYSQIITGLEFFEMWTALEKLTRKKVDLVTENSLSTYVRKYVENDKILLYEKK
jgi:predicted nucleotidyltransferase